VEASAIRLLKRRKDTTHSSGGLSIHSEISKMGGFVPLRIAARSSREPNNEGSLWRATDTIFLRVPVTSPTSKAGPSSEKEDGTDVTGQIRTIHAFSYLQAEHNEGRILPLDSAQFSVCIR
jgi:hypothetical protein